jgi:3-oxoacyl-[acyl-carrier protein] reductase
MNTLIISGASKGIGLATAKAFADTGYRVINLSRHPAEDDRIENHAVDLLQPNASDKLDDIFKRQLTAGPLTLVHNAAKLINDSVENSTPGDLRDILELNVVAPQLLNSKLLPYMHAGSAIIYVGSTLSEKAVANSFSYVTSKHAIVGMMKATCQDLSGKQIHTACVCPGFTNTEMLREHVGYQEEVLTDIASASTFGRLIEPSEIAETIMFAARSPVVNGAVMHCNLGQKES